MTQGSSFRDQSVAPTQEEIRACAPASPVPVNQIDRRYPSSLTYLETHFRLLREDCLQPLRTGIQEYRAGFPGRDVRIYTDVRVLGVRCGPAGMEYRLGFEIPGGKPVRWASSKRLMFGALLCASADGFETALFATVAGRDVRELEAGTVDVRFLEPPGAAAGVDASAHYVVAEASAAYFEAYSHVLRSLQQEEMERLPFAEHLLALEPRVEPPAFLEPRASGAAQDFLRMGAAFPERGARRSFHVLRPWPDLESTLDASQLEALKRVLTKRLAIVQGPPGTGKTFLGVLATRVILQNLSGRDSGSDSDSEADSKADSESESSRPVIEPPILVVCFTNHALDQFLEEILKTEKNVVRIGGQCKSDALKSRNLQQLTQERRNARQLAAAHHQRRLAAKQERDEVDARIAGCVERLGLSSLTRDALAGVATEEQIEALFGRMVNTWQSEENSGQLVAAWLEGMGRWGRRERRRAGRTEEAEERGAERNANRFAVMMEEERVRMQIFRIL